LKTRKALKAITPGDFLEVHCTDPLVGDRYPEPDPGNRRQVEITEQAEARIVFLIEKANGPIAKSNDMPPAVG